MRHRERIDPTRGALLFVTAAGLVVAQRRAGAGANQHRQVHAAHLFDGKTGLVQGFSGRNESHPAAGGGGLE